MEMDQVVPDFDDLLTLGKGSPFITWNGKQIEIKEFVQKTIKFVHADWKKEEQLAFKTRCSSIIITLGKSHSGYFEYCMQKAESTD